MSRSAKGFCHGLCGAVRTALHSVAKLLAVDLVTVAQEIGGRAESSGKASTICWAVQWAVGCSVTLKWMTRRRW